MQENLDILAKRDNMVMTIIKTSEFSRVIAHTDKGDLCLKLPFKGTGEDYIFVLDAVPFSKDDTKLLLNLLESTIFRTVTAGATRPAPVTRMEIPEFLKGDRLAGVNNTDPATYGENAPKIPVGTPPLQPDLPIDKSVPPEDIHVNTSEEINGTI